jgi:transposase InsO family protein
MRKNKGKLLILKIANALKGGRATKKISCSDKTMRLKSEQRQMIGVMIKIKIRINVIARSLSCSRQTIWYWKNQDLRCRFDITRNYLSKITIEAETSILFFRSLGYGTARIQQRLFCAPELELKRMDISIQGLIVSRQTINKILKKHKINGYKSRKGKSWKFFRAKYANELWQIDLKEFKFNGKKYYFLVCIDDYSRFILCLKLFGHCPTTDELTSALQKLNIKPEKILSDNGGQFKEQWKKWCKENNIEAIFAHPYYPQDKGKVERTIRNVAEELINLIIIFHNLMKNDEISGWINWFNEKRFHRGIKGFPAELYVKI